MRGENIKNYIFIQVLNRLYTRFKFFSLRDSLAWQLFMIDMGDEDGAPKSGVGFSQKNGSNQIALYMYVGRSMTRNFQRESFLFLEARNEKSRREHRLREGWNSVDFSCAHFINCEL